MKNLLMMAIDTFKILFIVVAIIFFITKTNTDLTVNKLLPVLGFGESYKVDLGLSLLKHNSSVRSFERYFDLVTNRVRASVDAVWNPKEDISSWEKYLLLRSLSTFHYQDDRHDLKKYIEDRMLSYYKSYFKQYEVAYNETLQKNAPKSELVTKSREAHIFFKTEKFSKALALLTELDKKYKNEKSVKLGKEIAFNLTGFYQYKELKEYLEKEE